MWPGQQRMAALLRASDGVDAAVAEAMIAEPRHRFVDWRWRLFAYRDKSLPTSASTTISQPSYIAKVISAAKIARGDRVLEIGTGSGWTAAVMARLAGEVITVERVAALHERARTRLSHAPNVRALAGDGASITDGNFDAILVMAGAPSIPPIYTERLRDGGRLIIPVGELVKGACHGTVMRVTRRGDQRIEEPLFPGDWNQLRGRDGFS
jgi:protein-L-isoaspartate(D-aspartate) O-methyltransferase